jgi:D-glycero-D-manno-heptose 1,7-bisphosphate phosphatase
MRAGVLLDRDGVLNRLVTRDGRGVSPRRVSEFALLPGAAEAVGRLRRAGLPVGVVTNQPDIARGLLAREELERMHELLRRELRLDGIYVCGHDDADGCDCRKPRPGLLRAAAEELSLDLAESWMVGDSWKDVEAARSAGCRAILIRAADSDGRECCPERVAGSVEEAAEMILREVRKRR